MYDIYIDINGDQIKISPTELFNLPIISNIKYFTLQM